MSKNAKRFTAKNIEDYSSAPLGGMFYPKPGEGYTHRNEGKEYSDVWSSMSVSKLDFQLAKENDGPPPTPIVGPGANEEQQCSLNRETDAVCKQHNRVDL